MKNILYATDGSASAKKAGQLAASYLAAFPEVELTVLYVTQMIDRYYNVTWGEKYEEDEKIVASKIEQETVDAFFPHDKARVHFMNVVGRPPVSICEIAEQLPADLIVIGSHGRRGFDKMLLGSVSQEVVQRSKVPVLIVKQ
jgi:nucleotide-binding universal stress UspA family protein